MQNRYRTREQLLNDVAGLSRRITELEKSEVERRRIEEALRQSHERYRVLAEATFEGIFLTEEGCFLEVNDQYARMLGYDKNELIGKDVSSVIFLEDRPRVLENIKERRESIMENRAVMKDGSVITVEAHGKPFLYDGRSVRLSAVRDITEKKRAEEELIESESRFRAIANYTYDWESWVDGNGKLVWVNQAVFRLTGYTVDECMTMPQFPMPLIDKKDRGKMARFFSEATRGSSGNDIEFILRRKDGGLRWAAVSWQPIYDVNGSSLGHRSSVRDITDRKSMEEELRKSHEQLELRVQERTTKLLESEKIARIRLTEIEAYYNMAPIGLCILDRDLRYVRINERLAEINGMPVSSHLGRTLREVVPALAISWKSGPVGSLNQANPSRILSLQDKSPPNRESGGLGA